MNIDTLVKLSSVLKFKESYPLQSKEMENNEDTISKLKFLGRIQKGDKINVKHMFVQPEGLATRISRSFFNLDTRGNMLNFVKNTIVQSFQIIYSYLSTGTLSHKSICYNIIEDIINSKNGIKNLKITYCSDIMLCCQLDTLLQDIDARLDELSEKYPDIINKSMSGTIVDERKDV